LYLRSVKLIDADKYGTWKIDHTTGFLTLFGKHMVFILKQKKHINIFNRCYQGTWNENWKFCCSLGLYPAALNENFDDGLKSLSKIIFISVLHPKPVYHFGQKVACRPKLVYIFFENFIFYVSSSILKLKPKSDKPFSKNSV